MGSLSGLRVMVTRAAEQADPLCQALRDASAIPVCFPSIVVKPCLEELSDPPKADWYVFSSANGARYFVAAGGRIPSETRVAAVGSATASALGEHGIRVDLIPEVFDAEHLAAAIPDPDQCHVVLVQGSAARPNLEQGLQTRGARVERLVVYHTGEASSDASSWSPNAHVHAVTFFSPSAVRGCLSRLGEDGPETLRAMAVATIGPITSAEAQKHGLRVDVEASVRTVAGLVDALEQHFNSQN